VSSVSLAAITVSFSCCYCSDGLTFPSMGDTEFSTGQHAVLPEGKGKGDTEHP